ncbi:MAG: pantoate--beta-alanine ligase [bacterium]|nr:MAG: pantoate--beta-alanine ligase [bacterium]
MKIITTIEQMREHSDRLRDEGNRIGFVPTMGFLHEGHLSLMRKAREENHTLVTSIFVNPTQFGPNEDFKSYPRDPENDSVLCRKVGTDVLFAPSAEEMYPEGSKTIVHVSGLTGVLCGASRPGHFDGVTTVVAKLFSIVQPHNAYFGLKDYQQYRVIATMVRDLNMGVNVVGLPTVREDDGLAMSSRNSYLSEEERRSALSLNRALRLAEDMFEDGVLDSAAIRDRVRETVEEAPHARIDYIEIVDAVELTPVETISGPSLLAMAVYFGKARLIDNTVLGKRRSRAGMNS